MTYQENQFACTNQTSQESESEQASGKRNRPMSLSELVLEQNAGKMVPI